VLNPEGDGGRGASLLILSGAGGVGSIAIELARRVGAVVIASASRPESAAWVRELGADHGVDHRRPLDLNVLKAKSVHFAWEFMFTRSQFPTADMGRQGEILDHLAELYEAGVLRPTLQQTLSPINAANLEIALSGSGCGRAGVGRFRVPSAHGHLHLVAGVQAARRTSPKPACSRATGRSRLKYSSRSDSVLLSRMAIGTGRRRITAESGS
jgi:NADPH:quinone reductase-like Zn-dependent oxidoreductase